MVPRDSDPSEMTMRTGDNLVLLFLRAGRTLGERAWNPKQPTIWVGRMRPYKEQGHTPERHTESKFTPRASLPTPPTLAC